MTGSAAHNSQPTVIVEEPVDFALKEKVVSLYSAPGLGTIAIEVGEVDDMAGLALLLLTPPEVRQVDAPGAATVSTSATTCGTVERLGVPEGVAGGVGVLEDVEEGSEPGEDVAEAVGGELGDELGDGSTTPFTSKPTP